MVLLWNNAWMAYTDTPDTCCAHYDYDYDDNNMLRYPFGARIAKLQAAEVYSRWVDIQWRVFGDRSYSVKIICCMIFHLAIG